MVRGFFCFFVLVFLSCELVKIKNVVVLPSVVKGWKKVVASKID